LAKSASKAPAEKKAADKKRLCAGRVAALLLALASKSGGHAILILEIERGE
jgi:hypothetical protein